VSSSPPPLPSSVPTVGGLCVVNLWLLVLDLQVLMSLCSSVAGCVTISCHSTRTEQYSDFSVIMQSIMVNNNSDNL
jgi:hypothetical protein